MWKKLCCCVGAESSAAPEPASKLVTESVTEPEPVPEPVTAAEPDVLIAHVIHAMLEEPIMQLVAERLQDQQVSENFPHALGEEIQKLDKYPVALDIARLIAAGATPENVAQARALTVQLAREIVDSVLQTTPLVKQEEEAPIVEEVVIPRETAPVEVATPVEEVATPVEEVATPVMEVATPAADVTAPAEEIAAPVEEVATPAEEVAAPIEEVAAPVEEAALVEEAASPVKEAAAPVEEVAAPVEEVAAPAEEVVVSQETVAPEAVPEVVCEKAAEPAISELNVKCGSSCCCSEVEVVYGESSPEEDADSSVAVE